MRCSNRAFSATLLEECSVEFIEKLKYLKNKYNFKIICDEVYCVGTNVDIYFIFNDTKILYQIL